MGDFETDKAIEMNSFWNVHRYYILRYFLTRGTSIIAIPDFVVLDTYRKGQYIKTRGFEYNFFL